MKVKSLERGVRAVDQLTIDDFLSADFVKAPELIHCPLTDRFHWLRITSGHTPDAYKKFVEFELDGYEYLYKDTMIKDGVISAFDGLVKVVSWDSEVAD